MSEHTKVKAAPHSKESEMMVLGCMLTSINALKVGADGLDDADFYFTEHKIVFQVLKTAYVNDKPADVHLVCEELKRQEKLKAVGGVAYITLLAQYAGTSAHTEEYVNIVKDKSLLRQMIAKDEQRIRNASKEDADPHHLLEESDHEEKSLKSQSGKKLPILSSRERLKSHDVVLDIHRGRDIIGLRTSKISEFNEKLLGLREFSLLAAAPNTGKTAFTIQLGIDVLQNNPEACLIFVSLEMKAHTILTRVRLHLAEMEYKTFVLGSGQNDGLKEKGFFKEEELYRIENADRKIVSFGERLQIIDEEMCPSIDARTVINYVEAVKLKTKCSRAIVIVDYIQVWPLNQTGRTMSEIEADKWRFGEMKKIRDAINNDPIIAISEARKPPSNPSKSQENVQWAGDLSDVMGTARGTYTPDVVLLMNSIPKNQLKELWEKNNMPAIDSFKIDYDDDETDLIKKFLAYHGMAICKLKMPKARDGMEKFSILLIYHFRKNVFEKIDWLELRRLAGRDKNESKQNKYSDNQNAGIQKETNKKGYTAR